jgi:hypothetical protein
MVTASGAASQSVVNSYPYQTLSVRPKAGTTMTIKTTLSAGTMTYDVAGVIVPVT